MYCPHEEAGFGKKVNPFPSEKDEQKTVGWPELQELGDRQLIIAELVNRIVAISFDMEPGDILSRQRGTAEIARARQVTAYLLHTGLSMKLTEVAKYFSRDRTTISHACRLVEDLRDKPFFDQRLHACEEAIEFIRELIRSGSQDPANE